VISAWLDLPVIGIFACLVIFYGATAALIAWLSFWSPLRARIYRFSGLSASYFTAISVLFALLTGFLAGDVIDRNKRAVHAVQVESGALANLHALTLASAADADAIREALRAYLDAIVNDEWQQMANAQGSEKAEAALAALLRTVADPNIARSAGQAIHSALVQLALQAAAARSDRLALNVNASDELKWGTVLFLFLMTQLAIGMVHLDRPRAHAAALSIFTIAAIVALGLIAIQEDPFDGTLRTSPAPLERVLKAVTR
jgi:hypothetical protein